jgi:hypothetical protein
VTADVAAGDTTKPAPSKTAPRLERLALNVVSAIALIGAALAFAFYAYTALRRFRHAYELEWIEGSSLVAVRRVMHGHQLYTPPTVHWTPNVYTPLYYWLGALVAHIGGLNFTTMRLISIVASLVLGVCVFFLVRCETNELVGSAIAAGLVYAMYHIADSFLDIARVDTLMVALLFAGLLVARISRRPSVAAAAATLLVLAILAKQSAAAPAVAVIPWMWTRGRAVLTTFAATFAGELLAIVVWLQLTSHGWFWFYVWTLPQHHDIYHPAIRGFWRYDLYRALPLSLLLAVFGFVAVFRNRELRAAWFYIPVIGGLLFASYTARLHTGGASNVLLPIYVGIAVMAGIGIGYARTHWRPGLAALLVVVVAIQFLHLRYSPSKLIPTSQSTAGAHLVSELRALPGPVLLLGQPYLLARAGHGNDTTAQLSAIQDVLRGHPESNGARRLRAEMEQAVRSHRYCSVVVDRPELYAEEPKDFSQYYQPGPRLLQPGQLVPIMSLSVAPYQVWTPRGSPACGARARIPDGS